MGSKRVSGGQWTAPRRNVPGVLLVLLTLLCALYPAGLPASQRLGSAFSPATESVTIRPGFALRTARIVRITPAPPQRVRVVVMRLLPTNPTAFMVPKPFTAPAARAPPHRRALFSSRAPPVQA